MRAAGMFSLWLPKSLGGPELNAADYVRVIEELSRVDGSVGWCASIASAYSCLAGYLSPDVARRIYGGGGTVVAGAVKPDGKAFVADKSYTSRVHRAYGSGIRHSTWTLGNFITAPRPVTDHGMDRVAYRRSVWFCSRPAPAEVIDTWRVGGPSRYR